VVRTRGRPLLLAAAAAAAGAGAATAGQAGAAITITGTDADVWNGTEPAPAYVITSNSPSRRITWSVQGVGSGAGVSPVTVSFPAIPDGSFRLDAREQGFFAGTGARLFAVDRTPPTVAISRPADGVVVAQGGTLLAGYACAGATSCTGTVPDGGALDTSQAGVGTLRVDAADAAGNTASATVRYQVLAPGQTAGPPTEFVPPATTLPRTINATRLLPRRNGVVRTKRPVLRWPARRGARLYNVQVFRLRPGRQPAKVASLFPRTNRVRLPPRRLVSGARYVWRVWPFLRGGYTETPLGLSVFKVDVTRARRS
jgi:hypothetical protein